MIEQYTSGIILAGGMSTRMGHPKHLIEINGKTIIEKILKIFSGLFSEIIIIIGEKTKPDNLKSYLQKNTKIIKDLIADCGPLGGLYTGLKAITKKKAFVCACDMPFLDSDYMREILKTANNSDYECIVPIYKGKLHALHAVYSKDLVPKIREAIKQNRLSLHDFICQIDNKKIDKVKKHFNSLININTKQDLLKIQSKKGQSNVL